MQRFVSILTIVAVLLCTFSCTVGMCCVSKAEWCEDGNGENIRTGVCRSCSCCRPADVAKKADGAKKGKGGDNQRTGFPQKSQQSDHNHPWNHQDCQGVCSGAILNSTDSLFTFAVTCHFFSLVVMPVSKISASSIKPEPIAEPAAVPESSGREIRLYVCSLTC